MNLHALKLLVLALWFSAAVQGLGQPSIIRQPANESVSPGATAKFSVGVGTFSPRSGTGAKVRAKAVIRGQEMWQLRLINSGGTTYAGRSPVAHFGLGDADNVVTLRIEWTSGIVQEIENVPANQYLTVTEPLRLRMDQPGQVHVQCWKGMVCRVDVSPDLTEWTPVATVTNLTGQLQWQAPAAPSTATRFYRAALQHDQ